MWCGSGVDAGIQSFHILTFDAQFLFFDSHQLQGRAIAFQILQQLHAGLTEWYNTPSFELPDEAWHLTADFESIRSAVLATKDSACYQLPLPNKVCEVPLRARSEFTPRYNPAETSIRSIIKEGVYVPIATPNLYDPPEPHNSAFDAPDSELDILSILENGNDYLPNRARQEALAGQRSPARQLLGETVATRKPITSGLEPGQGWYLMTKSAPDNCDGSWDSFCGRSADNDCLLSGHNDLRGGLGFDSLSGWMIVNLEKVKHGIVIVRIEDWWGPANNKRTWNWKCENGKTDCAEAAGGNKQRERQHQIRRSLGACEDFVFEFAIDGKITSWDKAGWEANKKQVQRVVPLFQLLDDANYTGGEEKDVELAIRLTGCARETTFGLSHIYWA